MIAALYIDPRGPYPKMADVDCWDEARDARKYAGPWPVVAHPPCGPWSRLKHLSKYQDPMCAPRAFEQVREFGGVLEHPQYSGAFKHCRAPLPGELPDAWGGRSYEVNQVAWGHVCVKPTWLYVVGVAAAAVVSTIRFGGVATHRMTNGPRGISANGEALRASAEQRRRTPPAFAEWLVSLARSVKAKAA